MTQSPLTREIVRNMLADHRQRLTRAQREGNFLAVANDICDEMNSAAAFLIENYGEAEAMRMKYLYEACKLEAATQGQSFEIPGMTGKPTVATQPQQIAGPKASGKGPLWTVAVFLIVGLFLGLARR